MAGSKNISMRGSGNDELVFLYDGIRINNLSSGKVDLSQFNTLGLNNLELISGNSDNSIYSSGAINIIPKINYDNQITFSQKLVVMILETLISIHQSAIKMFQSMLDYHKVIFTGV
ncbi:MAG: hypothetical protein CM15mP87_01590 [Candidatus Neomarinimicrobiota bacterium]|nr:MAG: hypothetical protein CM15mP87_01590 [Candidatus Neomarinimicrobiota bacterium]